MLAMAPRGNYDNAARKRPPAVHTARTVGIKGQTPGTRDILTTHCADGALTGTKGQRHSLPTATTWLLDVHIDCSVRLLRSASQP